MTEQEARIIVRKIQRCLTSVPDDVIIIIGSNQVCAIDRQVYREHETEPEKCKVLAYESGGMRNILGYEEWT